MPFINSKVTVSLKKKKKENIKSRLGEIIRLIPGKSENWLMVGFEDNYSLYFKGNQDDETAFVEVRLFGSANSQVYNTLTSEICKIMEEEAGIPKSRVYVEYEEVEHWGWNGGNL